MSESASPAPEPAAPRKGRRWIVGVLLTLLVGGGAYWWRNRLTPEEQFLVGRWEAIVTTNKGQIDKVIVEFCSNRVVSSQSDMYHWYANHGRVSLFEFQPTSDPVLQWLPGSFNSWNVDEIDHLQIEILGHDKIVWHDKFGWKVELRRIVEK